MTERSLCAVILAAGAGTRMKSARPKPLHLLCGRPMVTRVLDSLDGVKTDWAVMVVGHGAERVVKSLDDAASMQMPLHYVEQNIQRGTGDAVAIAMASLPAQVSDEADNADILILPGDMPLLESDVVTQLVNHHRDSAAAATVLTVTPDDPTGYGRIVRDRNGRVRKIVEQRDADEEQRAINEVNTSVYCFRTSLLGTALRRITTENAQGELYLTDAIEILSEAGHPVETVAAAGVAWAVGVNDRAQLAVAEAELRRRINDRWMRAGVTMVDPANTYIDFDVEIAEDVTINPGTRLRGNTKIATGSEIGPDAELIDCTVGSGVKMLRVQGNLASVGDGAQVGPYCVLEPGSRVEANVKVGPFARVTANDD
jgi:bifunctional UDP-N-acetylglucosamine pyrophosphorylase / glucosamine-1-phosphate N-acetyltransferase